MKRLTSFLLCLCVLLLAAGCGEGNSKATHDVDISYFANMGTFPESELKLGDNVPKEKADDETRYFVDSGERSYVSVGTFNGFFDISEAEPKIYAVAGFDTCYGFENGSISIEITNALDQQAIEYTERAPAENELFFLPAGYERSVIECKSLKHKLIFVFEENALCAALIS